MKNLKIYKKNINNFYCYILIPTSVFYFIYNNTNNLKASFLASSYTFGYQTLRKVRKKILYNNNSFNKLN